MSVQMDRGRFNGRIQKALIQRGFEKGEPIEMKLEELISTGCDCGNRNDFTLCYCENEFQYIECARCERRHYLKDLEKGDD